MLNVCNTKNVVLARFFDNDIVILFFPQLAESHGNVCSIPGMCDYASMFLLIINCDIMKLVAPLHPLFISYIFGRELDWTELKYD